MSEKKWIWTWGKAVHLMTTNCPLAARQDYYDYDFGRTPIIMIIIIVERSYNYCGQHFWNLLCMDLRQRRPSYDYKSFLGPLAGIIIMMIVVAARNYNSNFCGADL